MSTHKNRRGKSSVSFPLAASFTFIPHKKEVLREKTILKFKLKFKRFQKQILWHQGTKQKGQLSLPEAFSLEIQHSSVGNTAEPWSKTGFAFSVPVLHSETMQRIGNLFFPVDGKLLTSCKLQSKITVSAPLLGITALLTSDISWKRAEKKKEQGKEIRACSLLSLPSLAAFC